MKRFMPMALLSAALSFFTFVTPASAQTGSLQPSRYPQPTRWPAERFRDHTANIAGVWYLNGNLNAPCSLQWGRVGTALFTDALGTSSWGFVSGNYVYVPLVDGSGGYVDGRIVGNTIVWSDGNVWTR